MCICFYRKRAYDIGYNTKGLLNESTVDKDGIQPSLDNHFANYKQYTTYRSDKEIADSIKGNEFKQVAIAGMISGGISCSVCIMEHRHGYTYTIYRQKHIFCK